MFACYEDGLLVCPDKLFFQGRPSSLRELITPLKRLATHLSFFNLGLFVFLSPLFLFILP